MSRRENPTRRAERTQLRGGSPDRDEGNNRFERTQFVASSEPPCCFAAPRSGKGRLSEKKIEPQLELEEESGIPLALLLLALLPDFLLGLE